MEKSKLEVLDRAIPTMGDGGIDRLRQEHGELKARLAELNNRRYLSLEEEFERKTLQKLKVRKKDQIAYLEVGYSGHG